MSARGHEPSEPRRDRIGPPSPLEPPRLGPRSGMAAPAAREWAAAGASRDHVRITLHVLLIVAGVAVGAWVVHELASVILALILAALIAYVIAPLVDLAERPLVIAGRQRRLSRGAAVVFVYAFTAGIVSAGAAFVVPGAMRQVDDMMARGPAYAQSFVAWERGWSRYYERLRIPRELRDGIDRSVLAAGETAVASARGALLRLVGALSNVTWLILIPILAFFLLKDAATFRRAVVIALPHRIRLRGHRLFEELNATLAAYTRAQLLACVLVGTLCGFGFAAIGIPYPVLLGVLAGVLEFVPLVGPLLLAIVAAFVAALQAPILALWAVLFLGILRLIEDYVIYPRLLRHGVHLHPLAVIVAIIAGAELDGVVGMFLAVPAAAIAWVVYRHWLEWRGGSDVGGTASLDTPADVAPVALETRSSAPGFNRS
jgi:predicted PurR-regulated permease PerM